MYIVIIIYVFVVCYFESFVLFVSVVGCYLFLRKRTCICTREQ